MKYISGCFCTLLILLPVFSGVTGSVQPQQTSVKELVLTAEEKIWISNHPVVRARISRDYPPFEFFDNGRFQGMSYDHLMLIGKKLGIDFQPTPDMPWKDAVESLKKKNGVDLALMITRDPSRESFIEFTKEYISFPEVIFSRKDGKFISGIKDLSGMIIANENSFIESENLRRDVPDAVILETPTTATSLKAVAMGKADAYIGNLAVVSYLIEKHGFVNLKVAAPSIYPDDSYTMGVRKDWPELARILDKAIASISDDEHRSIDQKWLSIRYEHGLRLFDFIKWILIVTGISLLFIVQLRRMVNKRTAELKKEISLREESEKRILQMQKMESLGTLAAGIAHDFNNILSAILGYADLASMKIEKNKSDETLKNIKGIQMAGLRARDLVKQILAFSRQSEIVHAPIEITPLIVEAVKILKASLPLKIETRLNIPDEPFIVEADPTEIHQIIMNLCTNASYAMQEKGGILTISIDGITLESKDVNGLNGLQPGKYLRLIIADTGSGIPPEIIPKIFEPFFTTKERDKGTGMGLSVVHGIITEMGGTISVYSEQGKGTTFRIFLPRLDNVLMSSPLEQTTLIEGQGKILLVDDEESVNIAGSGILRHLGYEVITAGNGLEAVEIFKSDPSTFHCVLTDMNMPGMTGLELAKKIKDIREEIPIVLNTGFSHGITSENLSEAGIDQLVMKPLIAGELSEAVWRAITGNKK